MSYTTIEELERQFGATMLLQLTDHETEPTGMIDMDTVDQALARADAVIDAALAVRYRLPLVATPAIVTDIATAIAIYKLHRSSPDPKIEKDYEQALKDLRSIAKGDLRLDLAGNEPEGSGSGGVMATDRPRDFSPENLRGFI